MKLRTEIERNTLQKPIDLGEKVLFLGSCFTENIGLWMQKLWNPVMVNPWGILFNPESIAKSISRISSLNLGNLEDGNTIADFKLHEKDGIFYSFMHHGKWSGTDASELQSTLRKQDILARQFLDNCSHIFVTFGTSWIYERGGETVANCHKFPQQEFTRRRLSIKEIVDSWSAIIDGSHSQKHWIFTVSPIRHIKDGLHKNQISKSTLILAIEELVQKFPNKVEYLPIYEFFNDDLRDYRFYADDLVHPSTFAIKAVIELVMETSFTERLQSFVKEAEGIAQALEHKPSDSASDAYRKFLSDTLSRKESLLKKLSLRP